MDMKVVISLDSISKIVKDTIRQVILLLDFTVMIDLVNVICQIQI